VIGKITSLHISPKWVFKYKRNDSGEIIKRKARLVAKGFTQKFGIDYTNTFSPTLRMDSLRLIITLSLKLNFNIIQLNVKSSYLNADLNEEIYMKAPQGHEDYENKIWKLKKAIYGLKQSGREWNNTLNNTLNSIGFEKLKCDPCIYIRKQKGYKRKHYMCYRNICR